MKRDEILKQLENEYNNIYEFTGRNGDAPLNILDKFMDSYNLDMEALILLEAQIDEYDPQLDDNVLVNLLDIYKEVVNECNYEFDN